MDSSVLICVDEVEKGCLYAYKDITKFRKDSEGQPKFDTQNKWGRVKQDSKLSVRMIVWVHNSNEVLVKQKAKQSNNWDTGQDSLQYAR